MNGVPSQYSQTKTFFFDDCKYLYSFSSLECIPAVEVTLLLLQATKLSKACRAANHWNFTGPKLNPRDSVLRACVDFEDCLPFFEYMSVFEFNNWSEDRVHQFFCRTAKYIKSQERMSLYFIFKYSNIRCYFQQQYFNVKMPVNLKLFQIEIFKN